jgi:predicted RNase H-like HicB family nuclease
MKKTALIEKGKDGTYSVYSADTESTIIGDGDTVAEAKADFENTLREVIEAYAEDGEELPEDLKDVEFEYKLVENIFINND